MEQLSNLINKQREIIDQNKTNNLPTTSDKNWLEQYPDKDNLLTRFNPSMQCKSVEFGKLVHNPQSKYATPKLMDVRKQYGEVVAESFLQIQIADAFTQLGMNVADKVASSQNVVIAIRHYGERLMLAEWLLVFLRLKNDDEVRTNYNQANFVSRLRKHINEVICESSQERDRIAKEEEKRSRSEIYTRIKNGELSIADYDVELREKEKEITNKYFNY